MDLVSVIVPVYNADKYLNECISSILNQTYLSIELILVDDGSLDGSRLICEEFKEKDSRVSLYCQNNSGVSIARNKGIRAASGKYICFVDADDFIDLDFIETMVNEINCNEADAVFCSHKNNYCGRVVKRTPRIPKGLYNVDALKRRLIDDGTLSGILFGSVCGGIYKTKIIKDQEIYFQEDIKINEDGIFNIDYCFQSSVISVISDKHLYSYRQNNNSVTHSFYFENKTEAATVRIIEKYSSLDDSELCLEEQLGARRISEAFWEILNLCNEKNQDRYFVIINKIASILNRKEVKSNYKYIKFSDTNFYKRMCIKLMEYRLSLMLFALIRFVYPILIKRVSR